MHHQPSAASRANSAGVRRAVGEVEPARSVKPGAPEQPVEARLLQPRVVVVVQAVDADHPAALAQQPLGQMVADEAGGPGQQDRAVMGEAHRLTGSSRLSVGGQRAPDPAPT